MKKADKGVVEKVVEVVGEGFSVERFVEGFDVLAEAAGGTVALRSLVFQLAISGHLVPGRRADGARMRANPKGKEPFSLPDGWTWRRVDEVGDVKLGRQRSPGNHNGPNMRPYLRVANVQEARIDITDVLRMNFEPAEVERFLLLPNDILLNEGQSYDFVGRPAMYRGEVPGACFQNTLLRFRSGPLVLPEFALIVFRAYMRTGRFRQEAQQTTNIAHLSAGRLCGIEFPLPPIQVQQGIVAKVGQLLTLCDELEARQSKKREIGARLTASVLDAFATAPGHGAFGATTATLLSEFESFIRRADDTPAIRKWILASGLSGRLSVPDGPEQVTSSPDLSDLRNALALPTLPGGWRWASFGDLLCFGPKNGYSPKAVEHPTAVKSLTLTATTSGQFDGRFFKYIDETIPTDSDLWLRNGDILVQRGNTIDYVGVAAVFRGPEHTYIYPDLMMKVRVHDGVDVDFIHMALNGPFARQFIVARATGTSGSMPKINQTTLTGIPIPLPPLKEQRRIVAKVEHLLSLCDALETSLRRAEDCASRYAEAVVRELVA